MAPKPTIIIVNIDTVRGWHVATSEDLTGLFVTNNDLSSLTREIPEVIAAMYRAQGKEVVVREGASEDSHNTLPLRYVMEPKNLAA